ncbi:hypothetical protein SLEP1_g24316 [Rubroshorea leprosula]|uniref:Uncharacterized protein n=1 Tax=Rubroshorea leprosula TaxID=152421 RepID=A0AAV5JQR5_9ROSI|nr:hypothetical protein SLEP1_g24316 [Rubroshorea leprosula]
MACIMDALGRSYALQHGSTATPCHDLGMDVANSCKARLLSVPCRTRARARACARESQHLKPYHPHASQQLDLACLRMHPCLGSGHFRMPTHVALDCLRTPSRVLSATSRHGPGIDASVAKARCVLHDPPCTCVLVYVCVVAATPCRDTDTRVLHARVHASACTSTCARARVRTCTPRRCVACLLDTGHTPCVLVAATPCHDALDFGPRTLVP